MITEKDLQEAIAECQGVRNPNASTCLKLAAFLTIQKELFGGGEKEQKAQIPSYSFAASDEQIGKIEMDSDSEFSQIVNGRMQDEILPVIDELMEVLKATNPRLYEGVLRKLEN